MGREDSAEQVTREFTGQIHQSDHSSGYSAATQGVHELSATWRDPDTKCGGGITLAPAPPLKVSLDDGLSGEDPPIADDDKDKAFDAPLPPAPETVELEWHKEVEAPAWHDASVVPTAVKTNPQERNCTTTKSSVTTARSSDKSGTGKDHSADGSLSSWWSSEKSEHVDECRERVKAVAVIILVACVWVAVLFMLKRSQRQWEKTQAPNCGVLSNLELNKRNTCDECGSGTNFLPVFGEYEKSWPKPALVALYFFSLIWMFLGMGLVCDQFMAAIEEITSTEHVVWKEVTGGARHKFHVKVWNPTVANLTLMALGSSAPEILLSATELMGNRYFAGKLGPSTIVGSAAFNLIVISAVCVSAIPAPFTTKVEETGVFMVTTTFSIFAYIWLLAIILVITPDRVDVIEGIITLVFFPIFVCYAFMVDKGWCRWCNCRRKIGALAQKASAFGGNPRGSFSADGSRATAASWSMSSFGVLLHDEAMHLVGRELRRKGTGEVSKSQLRRQHTGKLTGSQKKPIIRDKSFSGLGSNSKDVAQSYDSSVSPDSKCSDPVIIGFQQPKYIVMECAPLLQLKVVTSAPCQSVVHVKYRTIPGTAEANKRYKHTEGFLAFGPGSRQRTFEIPIIHDEQWDHTEEFYVELLDLQIKKDTGIQSSGRSSVVFSNRASTTRLGNTKATIMVVNPDEPGGVLGFPVDEVQVSEGSNILLHVARKESACGRITCRYETVDGTAIADSDYVPAKGVLTFEPGERHKSISIEIKDSKELSKWEKEEIFYVKLTDATGGAVFDRHTEGGVEYSRCDICIAADKASRSVRMIRVISPNVDQWRKALVLWRAQVIEAIYCCGSAKEQAEAGLADWIFHVIALFWKLIFIFVPPPSLLGGWACFFSALFMIGIVTAVTGDVASLLGCCMTIPDNATAISLVALGTSLPDTFASRTAAQQDATADNAIGNITGSNSVNVFLGIGISWTIGALYWRKHGVTTEWLDWVHDDQSYRERYWPDHPQGGFIVPAGALSFTVSVYIICAAICLTLLCWRRAMYGGELGGPAFAQKRDAIFLVCLWVVYIALSVVGEYVLPKCDNGTPFC